MDILPSIVPEFANDVRFPIDVDSRYDALAVATTDSGMQSQFERFRIRNLMTFWYDITLHGQEFSDLDDYEVFEVEKASYNPDNDTSNVTLRADHYLRHSVLQNACNCRVADKSIIRQSRMQFPDPINKYSDLVDVKMYPI